VTIFLLFCHFPVIFSQDIVIFAQSSVFLKGENVAIKCSFKRDTRVLKIGKRVGGLFNKEDVMSIQKLKKGFTLIELMVVIVIIGVLAAIAIPKLFGMSAKAKASEVSPAAGTWIKLQQAYKMETGSFGANAAIISYTAPTSTNFNYDPNPGLEWVASSRFGTNECRENTEWIVEFTEGPNSNDPTTVEIKNAANSSTGGCKALTPNFCKLGGGPGSGDCL
jgi:type IV pilus assembly protein PilA